MEAFGPEIEAKAINKKALDRMRKKISDKITEEGFGSCIEISWPLIDETVEAMSRELNPRGIYLVYTGACDTFVISNSPDAEGYNAAYIEPKDRDTETKTSKDLSYGRCPEPLEWFFIFMIFASGSLLLSLVNAGLQMLS
jgi:hypothetical protein